MQDILALKRVLESPRKIAITTHHKPDADALGSSLAWAGYLTKLGHKVQVVSPTDYPDFLNWMAGHQDVLVYTNEKDVEAAEVAMAEADLICCLDFSCLDRINSLGEVVRKSPAKKVLIDHHLEPENFADFVFWDIKAAATAEIVYDMIMLMDGRDLIDVEIAECLYAGIMTDTGSFKHPNTTRHVHEVTADLIDLGADTAKVGKLVYDNNNINRLKFIGFALSERLQVIPEYKTAYFAISAEDLSRFESRTGDTEGLVNYALSLENIIFAAVLIDRTEAVKISFRSVGDFPANTFAKNHFRGGGHKNAAGGISDDTLQATVEKFIKLLPQYKEEFNATNQTVNLHA